MDNEFSKPIKRLTYKNLDVWKQARSLAISVYKVCDKDPLRRSWGLCDQMQRAAISIPSNIAEGDERGTNKDALRFLFISKGSLAELRTQLDIAHATEKITGFEYEELECASGHVERLLGGMIRRRLEREKLGHHTDTRSSSA